MLYEALRTKPKSLSAWPGVCFSRGLFLKHSAKFHPLLLQMYMDMLINCHLVQRLDKNISLDKQVLVTQFLLTPREQAQVSSGNERLEGSLILVVILISKSHGNFQNEYDSDIANPYNIYDSSSLSTEEAQGYQAKTSVQLSAQSLGHGKIKPMASFSLIITSARGKRNSLRFIPKSVGNDSIDSSKLCFLLD
ncbi:hypothetical protein GRJ2_001886700 [Grus japonensis]|uniref:Uncharacterized protein n=1 Tax=Grus japonensis TaxID=30415 RepID=A0ABC9XAX4_GRUJA